MAFTCMNWAVLCGFVQIQGKGGILRLRIVSSPLVRGRAAQVSDEGKGILPYIQCKKGGLFGDLFAKFE